MAYSVHTAPNTYKYQLSKFSLGSARSFAPIINGSIKFPSAAGTIGTRKKNTMITPCIVNSRL